MQGVPQRASGREPAARLSRPADRWLLFVLQLPARPSNARVKIWRRLQQLGAVAVKNGVYVLPDSAQRLEDFQWLRSEVGGLGGEASIFTASSVEHVSGAEILAQFRAARARDFKTLLAEIRRLNVRKRGRQPGSPLKELRALRDRLEHVKAIDFFAAPGGAEAEAALAAVERDLAPTPTPTRALADVPIDRRLYTRRTWVTRPRPGVDRFASAWLIQRFIDPEAQFVFAPDADGASDGVPFDMYEAGFRHEADRCTFEVLQRRFGVDDPIVRQIGEIVHDIDLKEDRYRPPQAPTMATLVEGLRASFADDAVLLRQGMTVFQALYDGLAAARRASPRAGRTRS